MICTDLLAPVYGIFSTEAPVLLYYSHLPAIVISLLFGFFVFIKNKYSLASKILFAISLVFSSWLVLNLVVWTNVNSDVVMFSWSLFGAIYALIFALSLYFVYVFLDNKDITLAKKIIISLLVLPTMIFIPTNFNLSGFNLGLCACSGFEGEAYTYYYYFVGVIFSIWIFILGVKRWLAARGDHRKLITLLISGIEVFLFSFFFTGFLSSYLSELYSVSEYGLEFYGVFSVVIFFGLLAFLVVKYKIFNIKLFAGQALVVGLVILVGAQFAFIRTPINRVLNSITVILLMVFGRMLAVSVRQEIAQRERFEKLTEELKVANLRLQELDKQKTEFLSIAAHQLRTPLSIINGYVELIEDGAYGKVSKDLRVILENIDQSNGHLIKLVNDFLDISRLEQGRTKYCFAEGNLTELVDGIVKELSLKAEDKKLKLEYHPGAKAIKLVMDEEKIRHAAYNFTDNALKYTPEGTVKVKIVLEDGGVAFRVQDTGMGFDKVDQANFFQKFYRGSNTKDTGIDGTGLGLFVCAKFIEAHGGRVWAKSPGIGKGSEFGFWLPFTNKPSVCAPLAEIKK